MPEEVATSIIGSWCGSRSRRRRRPGSPGFAWCWCWGRSLPCRGR